MEPMEYIYEKYCKDQNRKAFAVGTSLGAGILGNVLGNQGEDSFLEAACVVQAPIKKWECVPTIQKACCGLFNYAMGRSLNQLLLKHEPELRDHFLEELSIDIKKTLSSFRPSILGFDERITAPAFGFEDATDYYK
mmetsp:Transcript_12618/g.19630  ORF Transcript_12618/g.19630 Transcript_12618/m.19630 type:complete len:136 (+) Transcript_12618:625-1032(+)